MSKVIDQIKSLLKIEQIESYTENGCNIKPLQGETLYRIDYWDAVNRTHPNPHGFASMSTLDGNDAAKALAKETFGDVNKRLDIPVFVFGVVNSK